MTTKTMPDATTDPEVMTLEQVQRELGQYRLAWRLK
jgi:hypothetical protein